MTVDRPTAPRFADAVHRANTTSAIEKWAPMHQWRTWSADWQLIDQWAGRPTQGELSGAAALSVDYPTGVRDIWWVHDGHLVPDIDTWMRQQNRAFISELAAVLDIEAGLLEIIGRPPGEKP